MRGDGGPRSRAPPDATDLARQASAPPPSPAPAAPGVVAPRSRATSPGPAPRHAPAPHPRPRPLPEPWPAEPRLAMPIAPLPATSGRAKRRASPSRRAIVPVCAATRFAAMVQGTSRTPDGPPRRGAARTSAPRRGRCRPPARGAQCLLHQRPSAVGRAVKSYYNGRARRRSLTRSCTTLAMWRWQFTCAQLHGRKHERLATAHTRSCQKEIRRSYRTTSADAATSSACAFSQKLLFFTVDPHHCELISLAHGPTTPRGLSNRLGLRQLTKIDRPPVRVLDSRPVGGLQTTRVDCGQGAAPSGHRRHRRD